MKITLILMRKYIIVIYMLVLNKITMKSLKLIKNKKIVSNYINIRKNLYWLQYLKNILNKIH